MIAPKMVALVRSPFGFALWNSTSHEETDADEVYIRVSDCTYLLSIIDGLTEATGESLDADDQATVAQIRADLDYFKKEGRN